MRVTPRKNENLPCPKNRSSRVVLVLYCTNMAKCQTKRPYARHTFKGKRTRLALKDEICLLALF
ncbi:hypothetical protein WG31_09985 [Acetobacter oryzifermentans]|uniref:Uncharacterized protein n=1 Tax=Acetobacter oryzifermentans TaxID=1633874 RepID=A0ABM6AKZ7_9PROT|nr:hypothetical protein WG31_09985 [Acetobacter oryzifermentans]